MSEPTYNVAEINPLIDEMLATVEEAIKAAQTAETNLATVTADRDKLANELREKQQVILEKVASDVRHQPNTELISGVVTSLVDRGLIKAADAQEFTRELTKSPDGALKLASRLITLSAPAPGTGRGIPKIASEEQPKSEELLLWEKVAREGA